MQRTAPEHENNVKEIAFTKFLNDHDIISNIMKMIK